jgi:preprotein translocase subunit SecE
MCACVTNYYLRHIHKNCSPLEKFYDDLKHYSKDSRTEMKKITHQIHVSTIIIE